MFTAIKTLFTHKPEKIGPKDYIVLALTATVFTAISLGNISRWSIWFDEAFGIYLIRFNYLDVAKYTSTDVHPPLYYWALKLWSTVFGTSELALRSMSLFFMVIAIVFVYLLIRRYFSFSKAVWALPLLAVAPILVRYADEARMYGMVAAIVAAATYVFVDLLDKPTKGKYFLYALLVAAGMWTHYFTALYWLGHIVYRLTVSWQGSLKKSARTLVKKEWLITYGLAVGLYLPWLPLLVKQLGSVQGGGFWIPPITIATPFGYLTDVLMYRETSEATGWYAFIGMLVLALFVPLGLYVYKASDKIERKGMFLLFSLVIIPVILLLVASLPPLRPAFIDRYIMPSALYLVAIIGVIVGALISNQKSKLLGLLAFGVVLVAELLGVIYVYQIGNYNKISHDTLPIRQTVRAAQALAEPGEPFVAKTVWRFYETHYYQTKDNIVYIQAEDNLTWGSYDMVRYNSYQKIQDVAQFASKHGGKIWYLADWANYGTPELPPTGKWKVLQEVNVDGVPKNKSTIRAVELQLITEE